MKLKGVYVLVSILFFLSINVSYAATLQTRYGGQAFYDPDNNVTWLGNANVGGIQSWQDATNWAAGLIMGTADQWALPGVTGDPFGYLYQIRGIRDNAQGPFNNIQSGYYWTRQNVYDPYAGSNAYWQYSFDNTKPSPTRQFYDNPFNPTGTAYAWAMHNGDPLQGLDVSPVPIPAALWMFATGVIGFFGLSRRNRG